VQELIIDPKKTETMKIRIHDFIVLNLVAIGPPFLASGLSVLFRNPVLTSYHQSARIRQRVTGVPLAPPARKRQNGVMAGKQEKTTFVCGRCGHTEPKWLGRCPACGEWNTFAAGPVAGRKKREVGAAPATMPLTRVEDREDLRFDSGLPEVNRVLGGGIVRGATVLLGGEPGIGKSTLMLQLASGIGSPGRVLLVSGEESPEQIKLRAGRVGALSEKIEICTETDLEALKAVLEAVKPVLVVVDSIQTLRSADLGPVPGTVNQMKYAAQELADWAKLHRTSLFLVGHVTKEGAIAGPKVVEHLVDTVLQFEAADQDLRFLRAVKNRFGSVDEIGIFRMNEDGLEQIKNANELFLEKRTGALPPGIVVAPLIEGSRALLVELQSLAAPAKGGLPRVFSDRIDARLVWKAVGVLERYCGLSFANYDAYVNVAGGLQIREVGIELPLCLSLYSARLGVSFPERTAVCGEVSLAGEIRAVRQAEKRLKTAQELGFQSVIGPRNAMPGWRGAATLQDAVQLAFKPQ
jgi:DNA repair protein RadA/Sms